MRGSNRLWIGIVAAALCLPSWPAGAAEGAAWKDFVLNQFITGRTWEPREILALDDNGELLLACRGGATREALKAAGLDVRESQIRLLQFWRLLGERGDSLEPAIPILGPEETVRLRERTREVAAGLVEVARPKVEELTALLDGMGRSDAAWAVLFSYLLDGEMWEFFRELKLTPVRSLSMARPLWSGEVWAVSPARASAPGTRAVVRGGGALRVAWTEPLRPTLDPFLEGGGPVRRLLEDFRRTGRLEDPEALAVLKSVGLVDEEGRPAVVVVEESLQKPLFKVGGELVTVLAERVPGALDLATLRQEFGLRDESQALVIAYSELLQDLIEEFERAGLVERPAVLADPAMGTPGAIADLAVLVWSEGPLPGSAGGEGPAGADQPADEQDRQRDDGQDHEQRQEDGREDQAADQKRQPQDELDQPPGQPEREEGDLEEELDRQEHDGQEGQDHQPAGDQGEEGHELEHLQYLLGSTT